MNEVIQAAAELQKLCESQGWQFCFIGGVALQRWGEPRETADVERIIVRQTGKPDWDYVRQQLRSLAELEETPEIFDELEARRIEFER